MPFVSSESSCMSYTGDWKSSTSCASLTIDWQSRHAMQDLAELEWSPIMGQKQGNLHLDHLDPDPQTTKRGAKA